MEKTQAESAVETLVAVLLPKLPADVEDAEDFVKVGGMPGTKLNILTAALDPIMHRQSVSPAYGGHHCLSNWGEGCDPDRSPSAFLLVHEAP